MHMFSPDFLNLQIRFAQKVLSLSTDSPFDVIVDYTILRFLLQLYVVPKGEAEPLWHELVQRIAHNDDPQSWTYSLYQSRLGIVAARDQERVTHAFGCFSFAYPFHDSLAVRLHFHNRSNLSNHGLLSDHDFETRLGELKQMFAHVKQAHPLAQTVVGGSWLYHLPAYRRLFPPTFLLTAKSGGYETGFFSLWGQFVKGDGQVRKSAASHFMGCLKKQTSLTGCLSCFPYDVLRLESPIEGFYDFYNL